MPRCPACATEISGRDVSDRTSLRPYRTCPHCGGRFTVDPGTRARQVIALLLALASLALTIGWCFLDQPWRIPTLTSYVVLAFFIGWSNRRVRFVSFS